MTALLSLLIGRGPGGVGGGEGVGVRSRFGWCELDALMSAVGDATWRGGGGGGVLLFAGRGGGA